MKTPKTVLRQWQEIESILTSQEPSTSTHLNTLRRTAGEAMISKFLEMINCIALLARAKALHNGPCCVLDFPRASEASENPEIVGGRNYHASITFDDGRFGLRGSNCPTTPMFHWKKRTLTDVATLLRTSILKGLPYSTSMRTMEMLRMQLGQDITYSSIYPANRCPDTMPQNTRRRGSFGS